VSDPSEPTKVSYFAAMDPYVYARITRKYWRQQWPSTTRRSFGYIMCSVVLGAGSASVGANIAGFEFRWRLLVGGGVFAAVASAILIIASMSTASQNLGKADERKSWQCAISDWAYTCTDESSVTLSIPLRSMRIILEDPDAWLVTYPGGDMVVFRNPLRAAGLEEEFRRRVGKVESPDGFGSVSKDAPM